MKVVRRHEVGSTNDEVMAWGADGREGWQWMVAGSQRAGRGRRGRKWYSPAGGLYASVLLWPPVGNGAVSWVPFIAGLAVAEAVGQEAQLKWPNDVVVEGLKVAGILVERGEGEQGAWLVVGLGVNLRVPDGVEGGLLPAGRVRGKADEMLVRIEERLRVWWEILWGEDGVGEVREAWQKRAWGGRLEVVCADGSKVCGQFGGLGESGSLLVEGEKGRLEVWAGDVGLVQ